MRNHVLRVILSCLLSNLAWGQYAVFEKGITELQQDLQDGEVTSVELVDLYLARIEAYDSNGPALNSIIRVNPEARNEAAALDRERQQLGPRGPLHGIPILVKDNYNTTGMPTTGGSVALADFVPSENATQVAKLIEAGAIILAKTNLHEYAYGITTIGSLVGQTRNPYDPRRVPGGSSGGTSAAVAASLGAIGLGSDTCGSIRIPSAFNNLVGLRPSKGLSSIHGVMPLSHTQDVAGPLARSVEDLAIVLDTVIGQDANDPATAVMAGSALPEFRQSLGTADLSGLRLGVLRSILQDNDAATSALIDEALEWLQSQGVELVDVEVPDRQELQRQSGLIGHEFRRDLNQYLQQFGSQDMTSLADIVDAGLYHEAIQGQLVRSRNSEADETAYEAALAARADLRSAIEAVMQAENLDALFYTPITQQPVFTGTAQTGSTCSLSANSGLPAISIPIGLSDAGLPAAMELLGPFLQDDKLVAIAYAWEQGRAPRVAPSTTPALENGVAPQGLQQQLQLSEQGIELQARFLVDWAANQFHYNVEVQEQQGADLYALVMVIDDEAPGLSDPVVLNLAGPDSRVESGVYPMTPQFRAAVLGQKVHIKLFGRGLPVTGLGQAVFESGQ